MDTPGSRGDQIKEMELKLHPGLKEPLKVLCSDPKTTIVVLSGSDRSVLDDVLHIASLYFLFQLYPIHFLTYFFDRTLGSMTCGWQQSMGCFYALQRGNG